MSERYTTLFSLSNNLYLDNFPFVISAGKLLLDNETGIPLVQLKIKTISKKNVSALKISITCYDVAKRRLEKNVEYTYLDINAQPNTEFGQKTPVFLTFCEARSFDVKFIEAVYTDGTVLQAPANDLTPIAMPEPLTVFGSELANEYKFLYGECCTYVPKKQGKLWICSCGNVMWNDFDTCVFCENNREDLFADADKNALEESINYRTEFINNSCIEPGYDYEHSRSLFESILDYRDSIYAIVVAVVIAASLLLTKVVIPNVDYSIMESRGFVLFESIDGYKNSNGKRKNCGI